MPENASTAETIRAADALFAKLFTEKNTSITESAPNNADRRLYLTAISETGIKENAFPVSIYNGNPEGCDIPSRYEAVTISPESRKPIVGARVKRYTLIINKNKADPVNLLYENVYFVFLFFLFVIVLLAISGLGKVFRAVNVSIIN